MCDRIIKFTKTKRSNFDNPSTRHLIGIAMWFTPMISLVTAQWFITLVFDDVMNEMGLLVPAENIINVTPSPEHLRNIVEEATAGALAVARRKTHDTIIYFSGNAGNKDEIHHIFK